MNLGSVIENMTAIVWNGWKWLEMATNGWQWLAMAGYVWNDYKWIEMTWIFCEMDGSG